MPRLHWGGRARLAVSKVHAPHVPAGHRGELDRDADFVEGPEKKLHPLGLGHFPAALGQLRDDAGVEQSHAISYASGERPSFGEVKGKSEISQKKISGGPHRMAARPDPGTVAPAKRQRENLIIWNPWGVGMVCHVRNHLLLRGISCLMRSMGCGTILAQCEKP